ncbi:MAG TPA: tRNA (cytidine(34)-2'-O)-methyltransferase [Caulobacteraceae bacterium]|jgi:tRNA (cytidine/uridine-2'-O-)-methyltransferase|nr:tRNA (cytidine(34)-2'-O)-methyltransferase [Caulobacteraceae bacterium]
MRLALFQPDIPQNLGAAVRLAACLGVILEIIEPCGFPLSDRALRRAALDYGDKARIQRRASWAEFIAAEARQEGRLALFTTRGAQPFTDFSFESGDTLLFGRESAGVPDAVHAAADARLLIPIRAETRSLNLVVAAAISLGEALRQTGGFPAISSQ